MKALEALDAESAAGLMLGSQAVGFRGLGFRRLGFRVWGLGFGV